MDTDIIRLQQAQAKHRASFRPIHPWANKTVAFQYDILRPAPHRNRPAVTFTRSFHGQVLQPHVRGIDEPKNVVVFRITGPVGENDVGGPPACRPESNRICGRHARNFGNKYLFIVGTACQVEGHRPGDSVPFHGPYGGSEVGKVRGGSTDGVHSRQRAKPRGLVFVGADTWRTVTYLPVDVRAYLR